MLTLASNKPSLSLDTDIDQLAAVTAVGYLHAKIEQQSGGIPEYWCKYKADIEKSAEGNGCHMEELQYKDCDRYKWHGKGKGSWKSNDYSCL